MAGHLPQEPGFPAFATRRDPAIWCAPKPAIAPATRVKMTDIFKEVDEDLRREQLKKLWDRFGPLRHRPCRSHRRRHRRLSRLGSTGRSGRPRRPAIASSPRSTLPTRASIEDAIAALKAIDANGSGRYPVLAGFRVASEMAATGDNKGAIAEYDAIAADGDVSDSIKALARLRAPRCWSIPRALADLEKRLGDLAGTGNPWRHNARELLGLAAWRAGDYDAARKYFDEIANDQESPADLRQRAQVMLSLIAARIGEPPAPAKS